MPPLVDTTTASSGRLGEAPSVSSSLEDHLRRCKDEAHPVASAADATAAPSAEAKVESPEIRVEQSQPEDTTSKCSPTSQEQSQSGSMEWVSSYFLDKTGSCHAPLVDPEAVASATAQGYADGLSKAASDQTIDAYFSRSDFMRANWNDAAEYIPPVGFAVVAGGLCVLNPMVFVGGALTACTAVGAVHAAQNACEDGNLCGLFSSAGGTLAVVEEEAENDNQATSEKKKNKKQDHDGVSEVTYSLASVENDSEESVLMEVPVIESGASEAAGSPRHWDSSKLETNKEVMDWVDAMYPRLAHQNIDGLEISGLNAEEFFEVFLANDAPFSFLEFQKKRRDKDIRYGQWEDLAGVTQLSLVHNANSIGSQASPPTSMRERVLNFDAKTNNGLMGPPYATTTKVQRCLLASKRLLVLEGKSTVKGVPFCDRFHVMERWMVTSDKKGDQYVSNLRVSCQVVFSKGCTFESIITSKSQESITEIVKQWNDMAQTALQRTEQARRERLDRCADKDDTTYPATPCTACEESEGIEVERAGPMQTRIAGIPGVVSPDGRPPAGPPRRQGGSESIGRSVRRQVGRILKRTKSS